MPSEEYDDDATRAELFETTKAMVVQNVGDQRFGTHLEFVAILSVRLEEGELQQIQSDFHARYGWELEWTVNDGRHRFRGAVKEVSAM